MLNDEMEYEIANFFKPFLSFESDEYENDLEQGEPLILFQVRPEITTISASCEDFSTQLHLLSYCASAFPPIGNTYDQFLGCIHACGQYINLCYCGEWVANYIRDNLEIYYNMGFDTRPFNNHTERAQWRGLKIRYVLLWTRDGGPNDPTQSPERNCYSQEVLIHQIAAHRGDSQSVTIWVSSEDGGRSWQIERINNMNTTL